MGIRESVGRSRKAAIIIGVVAIVTVLGATIFQLSGRNNGGLLPGAGAGKAWFTDDDGRTWFADDADRISPFDHNGKKAYRCYVWTADGGKTKFVSHLERLKPSRMKALQSAGSNKPRDFILPAMDTEVKPPLTGDRGWTDYGSPSAAAIRTPKPPPGQHGTPVAVKPE